MNKFLFELMCKGKFKEGACTLRLKMEPLSDNPNLRDPVAFRIKYESHYRTKMEFCVFPSYDFAHCLTDSIEGITNSYCTLEFESRNAQYHNIISLLDMHQPVVYEFSRLNVEGGITSKRKIKKLIEDGLLEGYDDPRLLTLKGLKRRGFTPTSLIAAVEGLGHTRSNSTLTFAYLESFVRKELNETTRRIFASIDPIEVEIANVDEDFFVDIERPVNPQNEEHGTRTVTLKKRFYIDSSDFRLEAPKKYFRLTTKNRVRLKYGDGIIEYLNHEVSPTDPSKIQLIRVNYVKDATTKVKSCISWVTKQNATPATFRTFSNLLLDNGDFNTESQSIHEGFIENINLVVGERIQIERFGYYIVHSNVNLDLYCITGLKEDTNKK